MHHSPPFRFVDLFAGIGGFHAALKAMGGECVYAVEIDKQAAAVYEANWGHAALGDITQDADDDRGIMNVPAHDVLCAGFPCQPFSKSGAQRGMDEARGTLFFNIASVIKAHHPAVVLLENVRNLIGPRHRHEWAVIIETLREEGYHVSEEPAVFSPHLLPPEMGGSPQVRERVFITATYAPDQVRHDALDGGPAPVTTMKDRFPQAPSLSTVWEGADVGELFNPKSLTEGWHLEDLLDDTHNVPGCNLTEAERRWIDAWDEFVVRMRKDMRGQRLPGHPIWADSWMDFREMRAIPWKRSHIEVPDSLTTPHIDRELPAWKQSHLRRNYEMLQNHFRVIIPWAHEYGIYTDDFPASRRKLEWQAQDTPRLWDTVMHMRPSGIRAKKPTYLPALVAITQTSIVGPRRRRLSPRETARLQGLPDSFTFLNQPSSATYKQMGNGVNVGAVWHVLREHVKRDEELLRTTPGGTAVVEAVRRAPLSPTGVLAQHEPAAQQLDLAG
ncbi:MULTISPECIES: DNA cytosine methyltransferase [Kytococcus]|uniref:DNA cytosine methyltransferase n=1 Tax=Kytococcus TaxID=57499 RepID=UPI0008A5E875|nr:MULTISPECIES: DNA cytosine methyltransferase [Kytococcus]OFS15796.1 DNA cytosine methyltransferase [Kytococcus sp. HMSC28H12]